MAEPKNKEQQELIEEENPKPKPPPPAPARRPPSNALAFWAYFTAAASLVALLASALSSAPDDNKSWFLSLPDDLRDHFSKGRFIKVHDRSNHNRPIEVFVFDHGRRDGSETLVLVPGLGSTTYSFREVIRSLGSHGLRVIAVDLPGSGGFSDRPIGGDGKTGVLGRVYADIKEKGLFWGFDHLVEKGQVPYEKAAGNANPEATSASGFVRAVLDQVIDAAAGEAAAHVHLVLHDAAAAAGAAEWASANAGSVRSVVLIDPAGPEFGPAFPWAVLDAPVIGRAVSRFRWPFHKMLRLCCSRSIGGAAAEAQRALISRGRGAVVEAGKGLNESFDLGGWAGSGAVRELPMLVLWSGGWSDAWINEGRRAANLVPWARFAFHSGGRWPQEDAAEEIAQKISEFVLSLPRTINRVKEEPIPEHIQKVFEETSSDHHNHHRHHHHGGHDHGQMDGYMNAYGLGHGWGM
ncbi:Protein AUXIN RESPONSE 4 [Acorus gramineus]|uniref:Protein AUXIN RESPONSE 4 n=1 Tax=Acorus gramineus TaxID=55184 RepID=A0AAV9AS01_ACOGR|nr:Protein AUXIN RESPONSE 4 [Acorus gramineus]